MSYEREQAEYYMFNEEYIEAMEGPDCFDYDDQEEKNQCGCTNENIWYDDKLGIYRCRNCGWSS